MLKKPDEGIEETPQKEPEGMGKAAEEKDKNYMGKPEKEKVSARDKPDAESCRGDSTDAGTKAKDEARETHEETRKEEK